CRDLAPAGALPRGRAARGGDAPRVRRPAAARTDDRESRDEHADAHGSGRPRGARGSPASCGSARGSPARRWPGVRAGSPGSGGARAPGARGARAAGARRLGRRRSRRRGHGLRRLPGTVRPMSTWADIKAAWSQGWRNLAEQASRRFSAAVSSQPSAYADRVAAFQSELATSRASLDRIKARLADPALHGDQALVAKVAALERRWAELAAGLYADATPTGAQGQPSVGVAPVLVVGGVALTAVGVAWALG